MRLIMVCCAFLLGSQFVMAKGGQIDFIENKGQWGNGIRYQAEIPGGMFFMTDKGFVYNFVNTDDFKAFNEAFDHGEKIKPNGIRSHSYKVNFVGANPSSSVTRQGFEKRSNYNNYFIGNDSSKWQGHVGLYGKIKLGNIYNGVDVYVYNTSESGKTSSLKYDFIVGAGVSASQVKLAFDGVTPTIDNDGNLVIQTTVNKIIEQAPYCYQEINGQKVTVASKYVLKGGALTFAFPDGYNQNYPLVIDPSLVFATFSTAVSTAFYAYSTTFDEQGNTYASGFASGTGWPTTTGSYQATYPGSNCVCLNKYSSDGLQLLYSTYLGGTSGVTEPNTMRVNGAGDLLLSGGTAASDFPVTSGAYQTTNAGGTDIYVSKLSSDGTTLMASTFLGGSGSEACEIGSTGGAAGLQYSGNPIEIAFDDQDNVWITSNTSSSNFPVSSNAYQSTKSGGNDAILAELNTGLSSLLYSTFIGGSGWDGGIGVEIDPDGNPVVVGMTSSSNFPATSGALHSTALGGNDGFVARFNPVSGSLINATYLGTSGTEEADRINFDCSGNVYVAGTTGGGYPISQGAWSTPSGGVFVHKLSPDLSSTIYSTVVGGSGTQVPAFMVDMCGNVVIGTIGNGNTSASLQLTPDAIQTSQAPFYLAIISSHFDDLEFGSYYGGSGDHYHSGVSRLDKAGAFYQSVCCTDVNFPIYPPNVFGNVKGNGGINDVATFKFNFDVVALDLSEETGGGGNEAIPHAVRGCKSAFFDIQRKHADTTDLVVHYQLSSSNGAVNGTDYQWRPDSIIIPAYDTMARLEIKPLIVPGMPTGDKNVHIDIFSPCGCDGGTNNIIASGDITIIDSLYVEIPQARETVCANTPITITALIDPALNYSWAPENLIPDSHPFGLTIHPVPVHPTVYTITATQPGAPATCPPHSVSYFANVEQYPQVIMPAKDTTVCINPGDSVQLTTFALPEGVNYSYQWTPAANLRDDHSRVNKFAGLPSDYHYTLVATTPLAHCSGQNEMTIHVVPPFHFTSVTPADTIIDYGEKVQMDAEGNAIAWVWLPVDYLDEPTLQKPTAQPTKSMQYMVMGMDKYGCRDTGFVNIQVKYQPNFFIPTAFTPNGDGKNDVFRIENVQFEKLLTFKIYNRLGQLVFDTKNVINGWDGTFNGKPAAADTYFYVIEVVLPDGTHQTFKGDITLVR